MVCISCSVAYGDQNIRISSEVLKELHKELISTKYKRMEMELPKDVTEDGHREKVQNYISSILADKELRNEEEVRRIFKLKQFYEQVEKDEKMYEAVNVPE